MRSDRRHGVTDLFNGLTRLGLQNPTCERSQVRILSPPPIFAHACQLSVNFGWQATRRLPRDNPPTRGWAVHLTNQWNGGKLPAGDHSNGQ